MRTLTTIRSSSTRAETFFGDVEASLGSATAITGEVSTVSDDTGHRRLLTHVEPHSAAVIGLEGEPVDDWWRRGDFNAGGPQGARASIGLRCRHDVAVRGVGTVVGRWGYGGRRLVGSLRRRSNQ